MATCDTYWYTHRKHRRCRGFLFLVPGLIPRWCCFDLFSFFLSASNPISLLDFPRRHAVLVNLYQKTQRGSFKNSRKLKAGTIPNLLILVSCIR